jgi:hypothetical protein
MIINNELICFLRFFFYTFAKNKIVMKNFTDNVTFEQLESLNMKRGDEIGVPIDTADQDSLLIWKKSFDLTEEDYEIIDEYFLLLTKNN